MIPRFSPVRNSYPPELMQLAMLLSAVRQAREVAALLGVPLSTIYRWRAIYKRLPSIDGSAHAASSGTRLGELIRACERRGVRVANPAGLLALAADRDERVSAQRQLTPTSGADANAVRPAGFSTGMCGSATTAMRNNVVSISDAIRRRIGLVRDAIDAEYFRHLSCDEFARIASMSKYNLINRFRHVYAISPYRYLLQVRIRHAKKLLVSTQASLGTIATAVGFDSQSSLSKSFRSIEGTTLAEFRRAAVPIMSGVLRTISSSQSGALRSA